MHTRVTACMCVLCGNSLFTCCYVREKETDRRRVVQQVGGAKSVKLGLPARRRRARRARPVRRRVFNVARNVGALHLARLHRRRHLPAFSPGATRRPFAIPAPTNPSAPGTGALWRDPRTGSPFHTCATHPPPSYRYFTAHVLMLVGLVGSQERSVRQGAREEKGS